MLSTAGKLTSVVICVLALDQEGQHMVCIKSLYTGTPAHALQSAVQ